MVKWIIIIILWIIFIGGVTAMGIKHEKVVSSGDKGNAEDWNAEHIFTGEYYWSCLGISFKALVNQDRIGYDTFNSAISQNNDLAPHADIIGIPTGATITKVIIYGTFTGDWRLTRTRLTTAAKQEMASAAANVEDTSISFATIDNSLYGYAFETDLVDIPNKIYGARITYTL